MVQLIPVDVPPSRDVSPADRSLRHYWGHLYRRGYNTGARYLEYIFNAFISGRAGTPEIAGRYLAVFQVLISSRSRCHTTQPPTPGGWGGRLHGSADSMLRPPRGPRVSTTPATGGGVPLATPLSATPNRRQRRNVEDGSLGISAVCARIFGLRSADSEANEKGGWVGEWMAGGARF